ncbi:MAG TPA: hypothetical protein VGY54_28200 [Polyangiaceae bacterium]|jgi:hypothetical protein|nr:hypothetical protein [Polyangiaceae bacterium]
MPIAFAHLVGLILGAALAWVASPELARLQGPIIVARPFSIVLAFAMFVWMPVVGYFVAFHGDWSYLYLVPWRRVPSAIDLALVFLASVAVIAGFCAVVAPVRKHRLGPVLVVIVVPAVLALAALPFAARRLAVSASYAQFHGDFGTEPIGASLLGKGVLVMGTILAIAVSWTAHALARMARESPGDR